MSIINSSLAHKLAYTEIMGKKQANYRDCAVEYVTGLLVSYTLQFIMIIATVS